MKKYAAKFWRSNPQLTAGGYEKIYIIEAKTIAQARKKAREISNSIVYGSLELRGVELAQ